MNEIKYIQCGILSPDEIKKYAVCEITNSKIRNEESGSVYDIRMGPSENHIECGTCGQKNINCPGHFGFIDLQIKVVNLFYSSAILSILKSICNQCSNSLVPKEHLIFLIPNDDEDEYSLLKMIVKQCEKISHCCNCNAMNVKWEYKEGVFKCKVQNDSKIMKEKEMTIDKIYDILRKVSDETMFNLGFNRNLINNKKYKNPLYFINSGLTHRHQIRPEWMILTRLPVVPPCIRPCIISGGEKQDDDLTDKYVQIIKLNEKIRNKDKLKKYDEKDVHAKLIDHINTLFDNSSGNSQITITVNNRAHKCFKSRLNAKEGHIRKTQAKRCDFTARSVIEAGPNLKFNQVSIPQKIASSLTYPVLISNYEKVIEYQQKLKDGKINNIKRGDRNIRIDKENKYKRQHVNIEIGDIVGRHIQTGDYVIMNRQPTLRVESMNGHEVIVSEDPDEKVIRLNLSSCNGYNADFDGDEMNIHVPQNEMAMAEVRTIMDIRRKVCSAQHNSPIAGLVQDTLVGLYFMTRKETRVEVGVFYDCVFELNFSHHLQNLFKRAIRYYPEELMLVKHKKTNKKRIIFRNKTLNGRILVSLLFPSTFNYTMKCYDDDELEEGQDGIVEIKTGILVRGDLVKKVLGAKANSIVHILCIEYGCNRASDFLSNAQFLCNRWFPTNSFTFGIGDCLNNNKEKIENALKKMYDGCDEILMNNTSEYEKELALNDELNNAISIGQVLSKNGMYGGIENAMVVCTYTGAKGNYVNCSQIAAFVGQQNVMGQRIPCKISNNTRCLSTFEKNDNRPLARGFIDRSFIDGLTPSQYFFHAQSGREGLMDTAVKTRDSGYIQRRFGKKMENFKVYSDGSVRNSDGCIISFFYGDEGFDPRELYWVGSKSKYPFFIDVKRIADRVNTIYKNKNRSNIKKIKIKLKDEHIKIILTKINVIGSFLKDSCVIQKAKKRIHHKLTKQLKKVELYSDLNIIREFVTIIVNRFNKSKIQSGDMVGLIAAISLGESATQQTLNSFHHAGSSSKAVTKGVPRLNELLNTTKTPKTPSVCVQIKSDVITKKEERIKKLMKSGCNLDIEKMYSLKKEILEKLQTYTKLFEYATLRDFVKGDVVLKYILSSDGSVPKNTPIAMYEYEEYKPEWWHSFSFNDETNDILSEKWVCEMDLDISKLFYFNITLEDIVRKCENSDGYGNFRIIRSPLHQAKLVVIIDYENVDNWSDDKIFEHLDFEEEGWHYYYARDIVSKKMLDIKICGIKGVEKIFPTEREGKWFIDVQGNNFKEIVNLDFVDFVNTSCDDMWDVYSTLGIEAVRTFLIEEFSNILCGDGSYIHKAHFMMLADSMTQSGMIKSVQRSGINRSVGPFTKATFECALNNFITACTFTEVDDMTSVSGNISFGKLCNFGTMDDNFELK